MQNIDKKTVNFFAKSQWLTRMEPQKKLVSGVIPALDSYSMHVLKKSKDCLSDEELREKFGEYSPNTF